MKTPRAAAIHDLSGIGRCSLTAAIPILSTMGIQVCPFPTAVLSNQTGYPKYDNYDAIEVPFTDAIPSDYDGVMGVPISFLDKYCPEQFEILGITKTWFGSASKIYPEQIQVDRQGKKSKVTKLNDGAVLHHPQIPQNETYYIVDGKYYTQVYARVLIRHIKL